MKVVGDLAFLWLWPALVFAWPTYLSHVWHTLSSSTGGRYLSNASYILDRTAKVLNFFPVPVSDECLANDGRRTGVCLNTYECRIQNGKSHGPCALGFGVCCVFTATCGSEISNNVTYFVSPNFPGLFSGSQTCAVKVKKIDPDVSQIRLDFVHFTLGQPNRRTGICDTDIFVLTGGRSSPLLLCGQNSGQHMYYDIDDITDPIEIRMNLTANNLNRIWEIKVTQMEFGRRAPAGCTQYYRGSTGIIQTMNFAINGRHLANQDYNICMRQEENMCSIVYEPCDDNSFKIGAPINSILNEEAGSGTGPGPGPGLGPGLMADVVNDLNDCDDRIVMPCDNEDFISPQGGVGTCDLLHCGNSFCPLGVKPCRIESSVRPFNIRVQFGPGTREESPEDNLGMCLKYQQLPCT